MAKLLSAASTKGHEAVHALFESGGPLLIEVRFPGELFLPTGICAIRRRNSKTFSSVSMPMPFYT